jgi:predicted ATP-grasp superfamily ATP-dependent carboligase
MARVERDHVLIAGVTTRALAVSACRAGYRVTAIDAFGDLDLREAAEVILARAPHPGAPYSPIQAAATGDLVPAELAAYTSNFENYPSAVRRLVRGRRLLGNTAETLLRVRNPIAVPRALRQHGLPAPETRSRPPAGASARGQWLMKPRRSGGGHGIKPWSRGRPLPPSMYLQEKIDGVPGSISFAADGSSAVVLGLCRQLIGDVRLGSTGYRYCGSVLGNHRIRLFPRQRELLENAAKVASVVTREFRLEGLNGIDFIAREGIPYPIEVNPRFSGSMELIERAHGISMFQIHAGACHGVLPAPPRSRPLLYAMAIVFARRDTRIPNTPKWIQRSWMADIPHGGERIQHGRPICTVFATGRTGEACRRLLWTRAARVYRAMMSDEQWAA